MSPASPQVLPVSSGRAAHAQLPESFVCVCVCICMGAAHKPHLAWADVRGVHTVTLLLGQDSFRVHTIHASAFYVLAEGCTYSQVADSMPWAAGDLVMGSSAAIWSFKEIRLGIGELDFQADDGFLEAILSFVISLPTADIWQVRPLNPKP